MSELRNHRLARVFTKSRAALRRYVGRLVTSRDAADDIVQEAFARTLERAGSVQALEAFLFSTARNLASNERRHTRIARTDSVGEFDDSLVLIQGASPEEGLLADEMAGFVREAVERLPPRCRAAFTLRLFHEYTYKEIAGRLNMSPKTVENHVARGLREVHVHLRRRYKQGDRGHG